MPSEPKRKFTMSVTLVLPTVISAERMETSWQTYFPEGKIEATSHCHVTCDEGMEPPTKEQLTRIIGATLIQLAEDYARQLKDGGTEPGIVVRGQSAKGNVVN